MTLTPWLPGDVKPVHIGVYQRDFGGFNGRKYAHWDGEYWSWSNGTPEGAAVRGEFASKSPTQLDPSIFWRGLAKPA